MSTAHSGGPRRDSQATHHDDQDLEPGEGRRGIPAWVVPSPQASIDWSTSIPIVAVTLVQNSRHAKGVQPESKIETACVAPRFRRRS